MNNYTLTQPTGLSADITAKAIDITGLVVANKEYDGNTDAVISGGTLQGVISPDDVTATMPTTGTSRENGDFAGAGIVAIKVSSVGVAELCNCTNTAAPSLYPKSDISFPQEVMIVALSSVRQNLVMPFFISAFRFLLSGFSFPLFCPLTPDPRSLSPFQVSAFSFSSHSQQRHHPAAARFRCPR